MAEHRIPSIPCRMWKRLDVFGPFHLISPQSNVCLTFLYFTAKTCVSKNILNVVPLEYVCGVFGQDRILTRPVAILPVRGDLDKHRGNQMVYLQKHTLSNKMPDTHTTYYFCSHYIEHILFHFHLPRAVFTKRKMV